MGTVGGAGDWKESSAPEGRKGMGVERIGMKGEADDEDAVGGPCSGCASLGGLKNALDPPLEGLT